MHIPASCGIEYYDGGAFAECFFAQYPSGLGTKPIPPYVLQAAKKQQQEQQGHNAPSSSSSAFSTALVLSHRGALTASPQQAAKISPPASSTNDPVRVAEHVEATRVALEAALSRQQRPEEDFSGTSLHAHSRSSLGKKKATASALVIHALGTDNRSHSAATAAECGPVIRSPTKIKKAAPQSSNSKISAFGEGSADIVTFDADATAAERAKAGAQVVVPFSVSSWKNKKKLIIPVEQRLAQQKQPSYDDSSDRSASNFWGSNGGAGIGDGVMSLAVAMQRAAREVDEERETREQARAEAEERRQTAIETAEAARARELLGQSAARLTGQSSQDMSTAETASSAGLPARSASSAAVRETREQRLERIRLERELRERERVQRRRQAMLERAAARMNISVAALEADASLLRTVEESASVVNPAAHAVTQQPRYDRTSAISTSSLIDNSMGGTVDEDEHGEESRMHKSRVRGGVFATAVISNENIRHEMQILEKMEEQQQRQQAESETGMAQSAVPPGHDGIRWSAEGEEEEEEEEDFGMNAIMKRRRTRL